MAGASVVVIDRVTPTLKAALSKLDDMSDPLRLAGFYMERSTLRQFQSAGAAKGTPWKPLKLSTIKRRRKMSSSILQDTGRLRRSVTARATTGSVWNLTRRALVLGTNLEYAAIHQWGGDIKRTIAPGTVRLRRSKKSPTGWAFAKKRHKLVTEFASKGRSYVISIPARPYLLISDEDEDQIAMIFERYLRKALGADD